MAIKIAQVQNLQQLDVLVAGPDDANHLFIIDGQFDATLTIAGQGTNFASGKETFMPMPIGMMSLDRLN